MQEKGAKEWNLQRIMSEIRSNLHHVAPAGCVYMAIPDLLLPEWRNICKHCKLIVNGGNKKCQRMVKPETLQK